MTVITERVPSRTVSTLLIPRLIPCKLEINISMEARRRSLQKRRIQRYVSISMTNNYNHSILNFDPSSDYISKASPLKISFTPTASECSTPSPEFFNEASVPGGDQFEPPELARRHDSETNDIYPSAGRDTLDYFLNIDSTAQPFSMTPPPPLSPHWQRSVNSLNTVLDHATAAGRHTGKPWFQCNFFLKLSREEANRYNVRFAERRRQ